MDFISAFVIFTCIWWVVFYMALPFGVKTDEKIIKGNADSAPKNPYLLKKIIITTIVSFFITWLIIELISQGYLYKLVN